METTTITKTTWTEEKTDESGEPVEVERTQYRIVVPKGIGEALDLDGVEMNWSVKSANTIEMQRADE